ncbi:hypothetical protein GEMRC1_004565 [Eukaryota sp. GEM-RC1]
MHTYGHLRKKKTSTSCRSPELVKTPSLSPKSKKSNGQLTLRHFFSRTSKVENFSIDSKSPTSSQSQHTSPSYSQLYFNVPVDPSKLTAKDAEVSSVGLLADKFLFNSKPLLKDTFMIYHFPPQTKLSPRCIEFISSCLTALGCSSSSIAGKLNHGVLIAATKVKNKLTMIGCLIYMKTVSAFKFNKENSYKSLKGDTIVKVGVDKMFVVSNFRRQNVCCHLANFLKDEFNILNKELAFSQPTELGQMFAKDYTGVEDFYVFETH